MEDFHIKHLSDQQMKELNPIIRQAIYNLLTCSKLAAGQNVAAKELMKFQRRMIPDYWELPDEKIPREELEEIHKALKVKRKKIQPDLTDNLAGI
ncbi:MAG: hypothetical protein H0X29_06760 [Parachlamydiaceae bacterium]|nr:hypothetical protein [Parachlamydiaceae bacterium]